MQIFGRTNIHGHSRLVQGGPWEECFRGYRVTDTFSLEVPILALAKDILPKLALWGPCLLLVSYKFYPPFLAVVLSEAGELASLGRTHTPSKDKMKLGSGPQCHASVCLPFFPGAGVVAPE